MFRRHCTDDVRVSSISDTQSTHSEVFSASCAQLNVVASVVVDSSFGQHGVVLDLTLPVTIQGHTNNVRTQYSTG